MRYVYHKVWYVDDVYVQQQYTEALRHGDIARGIILSLLDPDDSLLRETARWGGEVDGWILVTCSCVINNCSCSYL